MHRARTARTSAVVTGAGSGLGRAFAEALAARGGRVVCSDLKAESAAATARAIAACGGQALAAACDVSDVRQVEALADSAERWLGGPVDFVVNNAGIGVGGSAVGEMSLDDWSATLGVNLWGVIHGCHVFTPRLRRIGRGGIVNVASAAAFMTPPHMAAYNVSKAGVLALSETLAAELGGTGIAVSVLCPTLVKTNILAGERIGAGTARLGQRLMQRSGDDPRTVVERTLDASDRGELYVVPQLDGRSFWLAKRLAPRAYMKSMAKLIRFAPRG